jgi:hypothetical protein
MQPNGIHFGNIKRRQRRMKLVDRRFHVVGVQCVTRPTDKDGDTEYRRGGRPRHGLSALLVRRREHEV